MKGPSQFKLYTLNAACDFETDGCWVEPSESTEGEWVRADDAAALLARAEKAEAEVERLRGLVYQAFYEGAKAGWESAIPNDPDWDESDAKRSLEGRSDG